ncbi:MAG: hypothetical protein LBJ76_04195 [Candidatus Accumulibacter sp.]|jgi:hypothetical protein|nr:hypothetical protein [Accumulibacter sp.]
MAFFDKIAPLPTVTSESFTHTPSRAGDAREPPGKRIPDAKRNVASAAARLMAEGGLTNFELAKRKALRAFGLSENTPLPDNSLIEDELHLYQRLFQRSEHAEKLAALREKAREILRILDEFNPYLTGPVLDGTAGRSAEIDVPLFTDGAKHVEIFLLDAHIDFRHNAPRAGRAEAVLSFVSDGIKVNLIVYPRHMERSVFRTRGGRVKRRVKLDVLEKLMRAEEKNGL